MKDRLNSFFKPKKIELGDLVCNKCKCNSYRSFKKSLSQNLQIESLISDDSYVSENFIEQTQHILGETSNDNFINESFQTIENTPCSYLVNRSVQNIENTSDVGELNQRIQAADNSTIPINHKQRRLLIENKISLLLSIPRTTATHRQCFICKKYANRK